MSLERSRKVMKLTIFEAGLCEKRLDWFVTCLKKREVIFEADNIFANFISEYFEK